MADEPTLSPQENFLKEKSKEGGLTHSDVRSAESYAASIGRLFDKEKGYSTAPVSSLTNSRARRGPRGPDSRDRDRTGRISKDERRALDRAYAGTSKSPYDAGKIQTVLARLGRTLGGQKEIDRQMDAAFGSGAAAIPRQPRPAGYTPQEIDGNTASAVDDDVTSAIDGGQSFRDREQAAGLYNTTLGRNGGDLDNRTLDFSILT